MKPLDARRHGYLDYAVGLLLLVSPWLFGFADDSSVATTTMVSIGVITLILSLLTDYPVGAIKMIPFRVHGVLETLGAIVLLVSPWLFGYAALVGSATTLAVIVSLAWLLVVALTQYTTYHRQSPAL